MRKLNVQKDLTNELFLDIDRHLNSIVKRNISYILNVVSPELATISLFVNGKKGTLVSRRLALAFLHNDSKAVDKVFNELAPRYKDRNGGYTRIIKKSERKGDSALEVILELV